MNFYFAKELYQMGIDVHACCPGFCGTSLFRNCEFDWIRYFYHLPLVLKNFRTCEKGAQNIINCALDNVNTKDMNPSNSYLMENMKHKRSKLTLDEGVSKKLWMESAKLCGLNF
jgi:hypothetical protein